VRLRLLKPALSRDHGSAVICPQILTNQPTRLTAALAAHARSASFDDRQKYRNTVFL
jgi:hypothetical protein